MRSPVITLMTNAAVKAGKTLVRDFGEIGNLQVSRKGTSNFVTKTDLRLEKILYTELSTARPGYGFLMEEGGEKPGTSDEYRWIIDPLDGTSNFIHAVPYFCIAIALERKLRPNEYQTMAGVIYDPIHNELFAAEYGKGAALNERRIQVSNREVMDEAMFASGNPRFIPEAPLASQMFHRASATDAAVRHTGATALDLAYVAAGRFDACWQLLTQPWDVAAGMLIVSEAGGLVTQLDGQSASPHHGSMLAGSRAMHGKVMKLLAG